MAGGCQPKMAGCGYRCGHYCLVMEYWTERQRQELAAENNYRETDGAESLDLVTFKSFLIGRRGRRFVG